MHFAIFYAWQSDRSQKAHRYLLRDAAREAITSIELDADIEDSPRLDHDTRDVSGTPDIANTIYRKIQASGVFLADLTFVGSTDDRGGHRKLLPNPNVMLELGYAARCIGWERIVCVMNTAFGPAEELLFDLRHRRWPICYKLQGEDGQEIRSTRKFLSEEFQIALRSAMNSEHQAVEDASKRLSSETIMFMSWHASHDVFWNDLGNRTVLQQAALGFINHAIDRLLDLELIDCSFDPVLKRFVYRWTYLGKLVLRKLNISNRLKHEAAATLARSNSNQEGTPTDDQPRVAPRSFKEMSLRDRFLCALFPEKYPSH